PGRELDGFTSITVGNYGQRDIEAALTVPLAETFSARAAINTRNSTGWGETHDASDELVSKIGGVDESAGRLILRWQPSAATDVQLNLSHAKTNDGRLPARAIGAHPDGSDNAGWINLSSDIRVNYSSYKEIEKVTTKGAFLTIDQQLGPLSLTSISAFWDAQRFVTLDVDKSPVPSLRISRNPTSKQYSQELRLASDDKTGFKWVAGALFFREPLAVQNYWSFGGTVAPNIPQSYHNVTKTKALFAEAIADLNPTFSLTVGGRYSVDDNDFDMDFAAVGINNVERSRRDSNVSGRVILNQRITDDASLYYSVSTGFQGGGYNGGAFGVADIGNGYKPEKLTSYEIGWKSELLARRLKFNGAAFYYDYRDIQLFSLASTSTGGISQVITNARKGRNYGVDIDVEALVTSALTLSAGLGLLDSKYQDDTLGLLGFAGQSFSGNGNSFISAPSVDFKSSADYVLPVDKFRVRLHGDYSYRTKRAFDVTARPQVSGDAYGLLNCKLTAGPNGGNWEVSLWGKNLLDEKYVSFVADLSGAVGLYETFYGAPRQYGAQISVHY
ncbi:MAG: TonB-dependent receptor, partial [Gammaproteobacteria bacterium]